MKKRTLPPLSRGWKTLRNLGASLLLAVFFWGLLDFCLLDPVLSFRRAERANWVGPSEIQGVFETRYDTWAVGTCQDQVLFHQNDQRAFEYWPRAERGVTLVPVPEDRLLRGEVWVLAVDVPQSARTATLELTTQCYYTEHPYENGVGRELYALEEREGGWKYGPVQRWETTYSLEGELLDEGGFLFYVGLDEMQENGLEWNILSHVYRWQTFHLPQTNRHINCCMEAVFYDESGREVGRGTLNTPA